MHCIDCAAGTGGIAGSRLHAAGISREDGTSKDRAAAAMAPALLAAAPEQALKAEASETPSEPELLFAPDFIISQVHLITLGKTRIAPHA